MLREPLASRKGQARAQGGHWDPTEGGHLMMGFLSFVDTALVSWGCRNESQRIWMA